MNTVGDLRGGIEEAERLLEPQPERDDLAVIRRMQAMCATQARDLAGAEHLGQQALELSSELPNERGHAWWAIAAARAAGGDPTAASLAVKPTSGGTAAIDAAAELGAALRTESAALPEVSEIEIVRHFTRLSTWNYAVDHGMYPLGSCTMKYNPRVNEVVARLDGIAGTHPYQPAQHAQGALCIMKTLSEQLVEITGMDAITLQPAAGAHGELTGLLLVVAACGAVGERLA